MQGGCGNTAQGLYDLFPGGVAKRIQEAVIVEIIPDMGVDARRDERKLIFPYKEAIRTRLRRSGTSAITVW